MIRPPFPKYDAKQDGEVLPEACATAAPKNVESVRLNEDEEEGAELTELYKMLSGTDAKTKALESSLQGMSDNMGKVEKKIAAQTQMMQSLEQQMEVTNKVAQDMAAKHMDMMNMMAAIQRSVVQLANQKTPKPPRHKTCTGKAARSGKAGEPEASKRAPADPNKQHLCVPGFPDR